MNRSLFCFSIVVSSLLVISGVAWAQGTAQLNGKVTDESGAVLPGVTITATQTDTGAARTAVTDGAGTWVMQSVPIGPYKLEIALQGFNTYVQTGIVLLVNATPVINAVLRVGNVAETLTVVAAAPLVDVRTAGLRDVVEQRRIVELPLNGRQVTDLIVLAGAAVNTGRVSTLSSSNALGISVAGGLRNGVDYSLDGAMHNSTHDNTNLPFPFPDALQEFSVATGGLSAANGTHSGASVNAVTKSGTNSFHGNAFEFVRDSRFNATGAFAPAGQDGKRLGDGLNRNVFPAEAKCADRAIAERVVADFAADTLSKGVVGGPQPDCPVRDPPVFHQRPPRYLVRHALDQPTERPPVFRCQASELRLQDVHVLVTGNADGRAEVLLDQPPE